MNCHPERTRISCDAALETAACAPFSKERRMKFANATKFNRKSGETEGSAVPRTFPGKVFRRYTNVHLRGALHQRGSASDQQACHSDSPGGHHRAGARGFLDFRRVQGVGETTAVGQVTILGRWLTARGNVWARSVSLARCYSFSL